MERQAFEAMALEHLDAVYRLAYHLTRSPEKADELVQDVYLRALKSETWQSFEERGGGMRAWLFTIAHNAFYSDLKKQGRRPTPVGEFYEESNGELTPGDAAPAWDRATFDWDQVDDALKGAIERLKPEFREILLLWGVEGLKYREIAEILEVPIGTVMSRLHRARKLVAESLAADPDATERLGINRLSRDENERDET
jgi:RNA polymerase sigma-70 factor (ECF subfamily)